MLQGRLFILRPMFQVQNEMCHINCHEKGSTNKLTTQRADSDKRVKLVRLPR